MTLPFLSFYWLPVLPRLGCAPLEHFSALHQNGSLRVSHDVAAVHLHQIWFEPETGLTGTGAADHQYIFVSGSLWVQGGGCSWSGSPFSSESHCSGIPGQRKVQYPHGFPMKRFVKCFFELLTQIIVKVRKCKVQRVCVLHFQLAGSGGCFFLMKLYH